MDENYLDQLLKDAETRNWDAEEPEMHSISELEEDIQTEEPSLEQTLAEDAGHIKDVAWSDAEISADEISELDKLDEMADLDMDHMDFDDIDFDDLDVTKMNLDPVRVQREMDDFESMNIDEHYLDETAEDPEFEEELRKMLPDEDTELEKSEEASSVDAEADVDAWMNEIFGTSDGEFTNEDKEITSEISEPVGLDELTDITDEEIMGAETSEQLSAFMNEQESSSSADTGDMEDLFAMLGIEGTGMDTSMPEKDEIPDFDIPEIAGENGNTEQRKKKSFMDTLFGDDEEDTLTPEQEAKLAEEQEKKKQEKLEKKAEKKKQQEEKNKKRKAEKEKKTAQVVAKKTARREADERALAEDGPEKKLNGPLCVIIVLIFLFIGGAVIGGTYLFGYVHTVAKASNYFERQKYGMAYREILGETLRTADQPLQDKIYTVMYIERQYEAYENYVVINQPERALDALLYGLAKYDSYYDDAVELGIVEDYNTARMHIVTALQEEFGLSEADAEELNALGGTDYIERIEAVTQGVDFSEAEP